jgi:hypothetical protein
MHGRYDHYDTMDQKIDLIRLTIKELYENHGACTAFQNSKFPEFIEALTNLYNTYCHTKSDPVMQNLKESIIDILMKWNAIPEEVRKQTALPGGTYDSGLANMVKVNRRMTTLAFIVDHWDTLTDVNKQWVLRDLKLGWINNVHHTDLGNTHLDILALLGRLQTFI